jgi:DNA sulfur modification protein DndC
LEQKTLNTLRIIVPGAIFLIYAVALGAITKLFSLPMPNIDAILKSVLVLVIGVIYRFTPLRSWINRSYHSRVNENIRSRIVAIAGLIDDKNRYTWSRLRRVFYDILDHDESLKVKGQRVMFNGLIWTSCADTTAIGILFLGYSLILIASHVTKAVYAAIAYFCCALLGDPVFSSVDVTVDALNCRTSAHWIIAFSGGKDSTAALKVFLAACRQAGMMPRRTSIIYCDTGVENPILDAYAKRILAGLQEEFSAEGLAIDIHCLKAPIEDRFFVRLVGRGYPPPTNSFRWCTTGLRIRPVSRFIAKHDPDNTVVVLGLRSSESQQRDRSLSRSSNRHWQKQREGRGDYDLFLPIIDLDVPEVWDAVFALSRPKSIDPHELERLYRDASGECPVIKAPQAPPCASGRFGCWTCTVVRKDKSAKELVEAGYAELEPFLRFRNWLVEIRNDPTRRWPTRRSGAPGLGPLSLEARREILAQLDRLESLTRTTILDTDERGAIAGLWRLDELPRLKFPDRT